MTEQTPNPRSRRVLDARGRLADRLRSLRAGGLPVPVTQRQVAQALGASAPLVSSWESPAADSIPPSERLAAYACFFATPRSIERSPARLIPVAELTAEEDERRRELLDELMAMRDEVAGPVTPARSQPRSFWYFGDGLPIKVISTELASCVPT